MIDRRQFLELAAMFASLGVTPHALGQAKASWNFDYSWLKGRARALSRRPLRNPARDLPEAIRSLDWDEYQAIRYRDNRALWSTLKGQMQVKFFHLGLFFQTPVRMYEVAGSTVRKILYDASMFDYQKSGLAAENLPRDLGFAGFRLSARPDFERDVAAFLGASYFRAVGAEKQYGLSARGLAVDCGLDRSEEFPVFTAFWLMKPARKQTTLTVYALLESASVTGAYRFDVHPGPVLTMDVDCALYPRKPIARLGIAPLTSMFLHAENDRRVFNDWRPEIHDSDGLSLWTGAGEWIWRPLTNPAALRFNAYVDQNPRGFGLLQRDRNFDHYQDDGVFYDRRPCLWVEPKGSWGEGSVQLVELPTADETFDNIVAFWNPKRPVQAGQELLYSYRLYWGARPPATSPLARVAATRAGIGGVVGQERKYFSWRFAVDFTGGELSRLPKDAKVEPAITATRGQIEITSARPLHSIRGYRAMFDIRPPEGSTEPIDIRLYLRVGKRALTETWLYQWTPPPREERARFVDENN